MPLSGFFGVPEEEGETEPERAWANETKSQRMNSMRSATPYWSALCRASERRVGEVSRAMTGGERCSSEGNS